MATPRSLVLTDASFKRYRDVPYRAVGDLANSDLVVNQLFWIGVYPGITAEMLEYVLESFAQFMSKGFRVYASTN
jgi:dTDP-4-amino-4,6-dideoxygalactose transaminase